jgi:hypothetical protein
MLDAETRGRLSSPAPSQHMLASSLTCPPLRMAWITRRQSTFASSQAARFPRSRVPTAFCSRKQRRSQSTVRMPPLASGSRESILSPSRRRGQVIQLLGGTLEEKALVDQWLSFAHTEVHQTALTTAGLVIGVVPYTEAVRLRLPLLEPSAHLHPGLYSGH